MRMLKKKASDEITKIIEGRNIIQGFINRNDRVGALYRSWGHVFTNLLEGGYYEFGVYEGETFVKSWSIYSEFKEWAKSQLVSPELWRRKALKNYVNYEHQFYGFDTFEGMPNNQENCESFARGAFAASLENVQIRCENEKMRFKLYKGLFSDFDDKFIGSLQAAAIVNIDSDLYVSAKDALEKVKGKFQQGTILLMDDYNCFSSARNKGERRALREFCEKYPRFEFEPWFSYQFAGQSFICHIND